MPGPDDIPFSWAEGGREETAIAGPRGLVASLSSKHVAGDSKTCYLVPHGERTILAGEQGGRLQDVFDGTTRTMMAAEMGDDAAVIWSKPDDWQIGGIFDFKPLQGHHPGGTNILFADGSLRFVKQTISRAMLKALITRDGGEVINPDTF